MAYIKLESDFFPIVFAHTCQWMVVVIMHFLCKRLKVTYLGTRLDSGKVLHVAPRCPLSLPSAAFGRPSAIFWSSFLNIHTTPLAYFRYF